MEQAWIQSADLLGQKVRLRPMTPLDIPTSFDLIHGRKEITDWLYWDGPESMDELAPWYLTWPLGDRRRGMDYHFAVIDLTDGALSGVISLRFYDHPFQGDIGYWIDVDKWGRGLATEAVSLVTWLAFEHAGAHLVYAEWFEGNEGSRRVLERSRFEADQTGEYVTRKNEREVRVYFHSLARSRWLELQNPGAPASAEIQPGSSANSHN